MSLTKIRGNTQILGGSIFDAQISDTANIQTTKLADGARLCFSDGSRPFTAPISGVTPTLPAHLATKEYVDNVGMGLDVKMSVRVISTANINLAGTPIIDGVTVAVGDRVLVVGQSTKSENGIYVVSSGVWSRSADADNSPAGEVTSGMFTFVEEGTANAGSGWVLSTSNPIALGSTALDFTQFSQAGVVQAGNGLVKNGVSLDIASANGAILVNADNIALTLADSTLAITSSGLKLADLSNGQILIGNSSNTATARSISGDVTLSNNGVVTINTGAISNNKIAVGSINLDRLVSSGTVGQIIVTNSSGVPSYVTVTGAGSISTAGVLTLANNAVSTSIIADHAVTFAKLQTLDAGKIIIGTASGNAQVAVSGDVSIDSTGAATVNGSTVVKIADVVTRETPSGAQDGANQVFILAHTPKAGTEHVYYNGMLQDPGADNDYTISGNQIVLAIAPTATDKIRVSYLK